MYPHGQTEQEKINDFLSENSPKKEDIIKELYKKHLAELPEIMQGEKYYYKKNDITNRVLYKYDSNGHKVADVEATNNKLASGWHKLLVDQKTSYLVGDAVAVGYKEDVDVTPVLDKLEELDEILAETVKDTSNKGSDWWHPYVDEVGEFGFIQIPREEAIPIYNTANKKQLVAFIRVYEIGDDITKFELWDKERVYYYERIGASGEIKKDASKEDKWEQSHFYHGKNGYGWQAVPFIEIPNNSKRVSDLSFTKDYIDAYDKLNSDTTNTLEDIQEIFYIFKGYEGTDVKEAVTNLRRYKGVAVSDEGGDVNTVQGEVPTQSIHAHLDRLIEDIYQFGQGVNTNTDKFGNSPSGIALKFLFSLLDMKASVLEVKLKKSLRELLWFVCEYMSIYDGKEYDYKKFTFTFNKSMLMNDLEQVQIGQMSLGSISKETIRENHPWVADPQLEEARMEREETGIDLDELGDGDDTTT
jgi:SPP1 family phage portal protein